MSTVIMTARKRSLAAVSGAASAIDSRGWVALLLGELDDQDGLLRRESDEHHETDLHVEG